MEKQKWIRKEIEIDWERNRNRLGEKQKRIMRGKDQRRRETGEKQKMIRRGKDQERNRKGSGSREERIRIRISK